MASFTDAVTISPNLAYLPVEPPMGLMIAILRAPELSATSKIDRIWIMTHAPQMSFAVRRSWFAVRRSTFVVRRATCVAQQAQNAEPRTARRTPNHERRTSPSHLYGLADHARDRPPFASTHRPRLDDGDGIAHLRLVL